MAAHGYAAASHSSTADGQETAEKGFQIAGRVGYATKGVIYLIVGGLAAAAAGARAGDDWFPSAISEIASQPFGEVLLWVVTIGLAAYCLWRLVEAFTDPERKGTDAEGIATRLGYAASGIAYGLLALTAAPVRLGGSGGGSGDTKQDFIGWMMTLPGGMFLVGAIGVAIVGYGCYQIYRGFAEKYTSKYRTGQMSEAARKVAFWSGKIGLPARGVTFSVIGLFVVIAAIEFDPGQVKGTGEALDVLARQPYGAWVLLAVAIGLFCYGVFCLVQARYRMFRVG